MNAVPIDSTPERIRHSNRRGGFMGEAALAIPPALTVIGVVLLIQGITSQKLLFASLASSAFLIYYDPLHRMNSVRVMAASQIIGCIIGIVSGAVIGSGYGAGAAAIIATILVLVALDLVHPPAISTALSFAFVTPHERTVLLFVTALVMLAALVVIQHLAVWTLKRVEARYG